MQWTQEYAIGVEHLDAQHRTLFSAINRIQEILKDNDYQRNQRMCEDAFLFLKRHTIEHFATEEAYMRSINDRNYEAHKRQHQAILNVLFQIKQEIVSSGYAAGDIKRLLGTLLSSLTYHTLELDRSIGRDTDRIDPSNSAATAMEKTITRVIPDMFHVAPELINADCRDEVREGKVLCTVDCAHDDGRRFHILVAADTLVILHAVGAMLDEPVTQMDELTCSAFTELCTVLSIHFIRNYQNGAFFRVDQVSIVPDAKELPGIQAGQPLCSLLFNEPHGTVLTRAWAG